jgi:ssDNA-binding Zn-finger/Zn-ribbon topoisomerase 1
MRSPLRILRDIRRNSRRVERNRFDRIQGAGFVLSAFLAPLVVWRMESIRVTQSSEILMTIRVFETLDSSGRSERVRGIDIDPADRVKPWSGSLPLADVELTRRTEWRGWPLVTRYTEFPTEFAITRMANCPASREGEVAKAARPVVDRAGKWAPDEERHTVIASWVFSSGAWWVMLSFALALALAPIRLTWFIFRRGRTMVRQGRIDRCHCPNCGYNAKHSILRGRCPECGSELYERPEY